MPAKLFVGNLSFQATEEDLRELFQQAGTVESVRIVTDQFTGRPRGFGFVEMATKEELAKAIEMLNGRLFRDRNLVVDEARPQPQRTGAVAAADPRWRRWWAARRRRRGRLAPVRRTSTPGSRVLPRGFFVIVVLITWRAVWIARGRRPGFVKRLGGIVDHRQGRDLSGAQVGEPAESPHRPEACRSAGR